MFISNNQLIELTIENHYFTKIFIDKFDDDGNFIEVDLISAKFLVIQIPKEQNLSYEYLNSDEVNIIQTKKRSIGDHTYDADDRIAFNTASLLKKGFCSYVISIPISENSKELKIDYTHDKQFGFDFIIRKEKSWCIDYDYLDELDDEIQKANPFLSFLNTCGYLVKLIFCRIYNSVFNTKRINFKMNSNPIVLMKLHYERNDNLSISFPMQEL